MTRIKDHTIDVLRHGDYTEMILRDGVYYTPANLFQRGIMACNCCGYLMPIDKKFCLQCNEWVICIHQDYLTRKKVVPLDSELPVPKKGEKNAKFLERFMRDVYASYKYPNGLTRFNKARRVFFNHKIR